ncbi:hypothetical protein GCM10011491_14460 [Brucella endophytica]|uniref:Uncharacterized protein n=1 Tax=Brucella endophytica TaxID=1963359 RepID=A0A916WDC2_9HYPH|nr:hypothetical protein [Brucella endophytica]GGA87816.1 hypothetical protein GCM10011491_14460 [Brucella endophytica]
MILNPALKRLVLASQVKYAPTIIEQVKSDLSELMPELETWPKEIGHLQPVPVDVFNLAVSLRDEARKLAADLDLLVPANVAMPIAESYEERVRGLERAYSRVQPYVVAEITKPVGCE